MSDPKVFIDYEFHFTQGEPLFIPPALEASESVKDDGEVIIVTRHTDDVEEIATVSRAKLNGWKRTRRIVREE